jgi:predicted GH43/DUF377 family glycosyl hydrolase
MPSFIKCHWRKGKQPHGPFNCESPLVGPLPNLQPADCSGCRVQGHYDVNMVVAQRVAPIKVHDLPECPIKPKRILRVRVPSGSFQGSILYHQGRYLYAYRHGWLGGQVHMANLGAAIGERPFIDPEQTWPTGIDHKDAWRGREDPRLFRFQGRLYVSFNGVWTGADGGLASSMMLALLDDGGRAEQVWAPRYEGATQIEKNWQFFEHEQQLYCVYSVEPHVILRMDGVMATQVAGTSVGLSWDYGHLRGGAPPVRVGDEYYHFIHGQLITKDGKVIYAAGVYTFEAKPPFAVKRFAKKPLMLPPPGETSPRPELTVVFPCGAVRQDDSWFISYGHNDIDCRLAEFDAADVEKLLEPVKGMVLPLGVNRVRKAVSV